MSVEYRDMRAATQRFRSHLKAVASTRSLAPLTIAAAVSIAGAVGGLFSSTPGAGVSPAGLNRSAPLADPIVRPRTTMGASADLALSSPQAARAAHDRWQAVARRVCQEIQDRGGSASMSPYGICVKQVLRARWYEDSML